MALLVGQHTNKIDRKGRVSVPKQFREQYESMGGFPGVYAYPSPKHAAIDGCHEERMKHIAKKIDELALLSEEQDDFAMVVLASTHQLPFDPEGRILLPAALIAHAGLDGEALFVGRGAAFQIWNPNAYTPLHNDARGRIIENRATLQLHDPSGASQ